MYFIVHCTSFNSKINAHCKIRHLVPPINLYTNEYTNPFTSTDTIIVYYDGIKHHRVPSLNSTGTQHTHKFKNVRKKFVWHRFIISQHQNKRDPNMSYTAGHKHSHIVDERRLNLLNKILLTLVHSRHGVFNCTLQNFKCPALEASI